VIEFYKISAANVMFLLFTNKQNRKKTVQISFPEYRPVIAPPRHCEPRSGAAIQKNKPVIRLVAK
jgi:hypothetical protein